MNTGVLAAQIRLYARELKMPGLSGAFEEIARDAAKASRGHLESLAACLSAEVDSRSEHRLASRIKTARFPSAKTFEIFDFSLVPSLQKARVLDLGSGEFTHLRENVVCLGASGTGEDPRGHRDRPLRHLRRRQSQVHHGGDAVPGVAGGSRRAPAASLPQGLAKCRPGDRR